MSKKVRHQEATTEVKTENREKASRFELKKKEREEKRNEKMGESTHSFPRKPRLRILPIWLRLIIVIVLAGGCLLLGLMFGYGVIGDGEPAEALTTEPWYHIIDIMRGEESPEYPSLLPVKRVW